MFRAERANRVRVARLASADRMMQVTALSWLLATWFSRRRCRIRSARYIAICAGSTNTEAHYSSRFVHVMCMLMHARIEFASVSLYSVRICEQQVCVLVFQLIFNDRRAV